MRDTLNIIRAGVTVDASHMGDKDHLLLNSIKFWMLLTHTDRKFRQQNCSHSNENEQFAPVALQTTPEYEFNCYN